MKVISKEDLSILIALISDRNSYSLHDFELLLNRFGDDCYIKDGQFVKTTENGETVRIRKAVEEEE